MDWARMRDGRYEALIRCTDRVGCRQRVEFVGDEWPIDERTPQEVLIQTVAPGRRKSGGES